MWDAINPHTGKRRIDDAFPPEIRKTTRENEMQITFHNGSTFQLVGSDNFNSLVGSPPVGLVFSEYALSNPSSWAYLQPIIEENNGWVGFNSTPRGKNHFKNLCDYAERSEKWFYELLTNDDTKVFNEEQLVDILASLQAVHGDAFGRSFWLQEYFCSFDAAIPGSIWGDCIDAAQQTGRIGKVPLELAYPVHTGWDLGRTDDTVIWFYQVCMGEIRIIDYHASNMKDIPFYADLLRSKSKERGFTYGTQWLPHDARPRTLAAGGKSIFQQFNDLNKDGAMGRFAIAPRLDREEGIQAARATMRKCWFDDEHCSDGIEALRHYHRTWDEEKKTFSTEPVHDWSSHSCLVAGTLVTTERGSIQIEDVTICDRVWTPCGFASVLNAGPVKISESLVQVTTEDGSLVCTPEHKIFTKRGFVIADALRHDDYILDGQEWSCIPSALISTVTNSSFRENTTDDTTGERKAQVACTEPFGNFITELFQKTTTFITSMATRWTIPSRTLPSSIGVSIRETTLLSASSEGKCSRQDKVLEQKRMNGMDQPKDLNGTRLMGRTLGKNASLQPFAASNAISSTRQLFQRHRNGVHFDASLTPEQNQKAACQERKEFLFGAFVRNAVRRLCLRFLSASCTAHKIVGLQRIEGEQGRQLVYDLTVEKHGCYQANGLLVSNSDAFRTLALSWRSAKETYEAQDTTIRQLLSGSIGAQTFGSLKKEHFRKAEERRQGF